MREVENETIVLQAESIDELQSRIDEATSDRIVKDVVKDSFTTSAGRTIHCAAVTRSKKYYLTE